MKDDVISRQQAIDDIREYMIEPSHCCDESEIKGYNDGLDVAISALATLPSAESEIILCKDCKYNSNPPEYGNADCDIFYGMTDQMGYCHRAERRTNEIN